MQKLEDRGSLPAGTMDNMRDQFEQAMKESGTIGGILRSLVYALILYPIFSMIGGTKLVLQGGEKKNRQFNNNRRFRNRLPKFLLRSDWKISGIFCVR